MHSNVLAFTTPRAAVQDTERTGRQTAKKRSFQNFLQPKQWRVEEIENLSGLIELVFMVFLWRICALFWDERDISSNNEERAAQNGHELSPGVTEKATAKRSWGKSSFILIFMLIFKRFDTIVDFPGRFWKTLPMQNSITACGKLCTELWATLGCFGTLLPFNWPLRGGAENWAKVGFPKQFPCPIWHNTGAVSSVTTSKWLITRDEETEEADRLYELRIWAD